MNFSRLYFSTITATVLINATALALSPAATSARGSADWATPAHDVIGVDAAQLTPEFWIARLEKPDAVVFDADAIVARNARLPRVDSSVLDLHALPPTLARKQVRAWIQALSSRPDRALVDADGKPLASAAVDALIDSLALADIPERQPTRYGLVVHRADLRTFPTTHGAFSDLSDTDVDRFQESALFPGAPVVIAHQSSDGQWWFVVSARYAAWVEKRYVALGSAEQVFAYVDKKPYRIVTGASATTVSTPQQPALSELRLDMGVRVPLLADWPAAKPVNGQHPYTAHVIELALRNDDGTLALAPALVQKNADTQGDYLALTRANILRQAFKFLGERYGWGHAHDARDCSGFVSDVYRSMGVQMPRNTSDQAVSAGFDHRAFGRRDNRATRMAAVHALDVGDLIFIPGHVMMAIGSIDGEPYVIHDTSGLSYRRQDGTMTRVELNEVSVSPLTPLLFNDKQLYVDRMTSIVRIRPVIAKESPHKP